MRLAEGLVAIIAVSYVAWAFMATHLQHTYTLGTVSQAHLMPLLDQRMSGYATCAILAYHLPTDAKGYAPYFTEQGCNPSPFAVASMVRDMAEIAGAS